MQVNLVTINGVVGLHIGVQLEVSSLVADGEVVLGHFGLGRVEAHLVPSEPSLVADHTGSMDGRSGKVKVYITADIDELTFVGGLDLSAFLSDKSKIRYKR